MEIKKTIAKYALKALGYNPVIGAGFGMTFGNVFTWLNGVGIEGYDNKIVYSGMNLLVKKLIEVPIIVSKVENKKALKSYYKTSNPERLALNKAIALTELEDHELITLLKKPNSYQTGMELMDAFWHNWLFGDGYLIVIPTDNGPGIDSRRFKAKELHAINRNRVTALKSNDPYNPIAKYRIMLLNGQSLELDPGYVFHMAKWNPKPEELHGFGTMNAMGKTVSKDEQSEIAQGSAFINGGRGTLFSSDWTNGQEPVEKMTGEQMALLKKTMVEDYAGAKNNRRMHFTNGMVNVQNFGDTLAEMQLIEAGKSNWKDIYTVLGIPIVLGPSAEAMTESNVIAGYKSLVTNAVVPDLRRFDQKFNQWIQAWYGEGISANHDITEFSELTPDYKLLKEVYGDAPYLTPNEKRKLFNFDTDDKTKGMNEYFFPTGLIRLADLVDPIEDDGQTIDYQDTGK